MIRAPRHRGTGAAARRSSTASRAIARGRRSAIARAESILPGDPEVLAATWGQDRVAASLFRDDIAQAVLESAPAIVTWSRHRSRRRAGHGRSTPCWQATTGSDGARALERARTAGAAVGWNRAWLAYARRS